MLFFQLHMQHENYLERGWDSGCEGSPSNQEGFRDHQELCQQVPSPFFSMSLKVVASNRFHLSHVSIPISTFWGIWSEWWGGMIWLIKRLRLRQLVLPLFCTCLTMILILTTIPTASWQLRRGKNFCMRAGTSGGSTMILGPLVSGP